ncbi:OLC1v1001944C1 [Oldenlandia corymbosa var. corymbosa]|uniref:OLC1v1001944C1 n=1 Tax=Oldenlandia corymbosa var. corymbosa TaxID=529605 RepID=A0AAV1D769_OLDCO|nr:OLC1v1001944C1 [Oldenlandia corymbosa var. corymbosa]
MKLEALPEECIVQILSFTSPKEACQLSTVSTIVRDAADSEVLWEKFLPSDYRDILSRLVFPLEFKSKKDLFLQLCQPLLIDGGKSDGTFYIDKYINKKCFMLSARDLNITWSSNTLYWCWKPFQPSRFPEVVELIMVTWLDIHGKINTKMLSPHTKYGAYLVIKLADRAHGLHSFPSEVSIEAGDYKSRGSTRLRHKGLNNIGCSICCGCILHSSNQPINPAFCRGKERILNERKDGWLELELGEFYHDGNEKEVKMCLKEIYGQHIKGGLIVEGIELRPVV